MGGIESFNNMDQHTHPKARLHIRNTPSATVLVGPRSLILRLISFIFVHTKSIDMKQLT